MRAWIFLVMAMIMILIAFMVLDYCYGAGGEIGLLIGIFLFMGIRYLYDTIEEPKQ